ncbi:MAG: hypothetical protein KGY74_10680 [Candidatus Cloacimonetes bacterium]|nr:hypothetical protein [Candidatus Cloacimonadota bacterium]
MKHAREDYNRIQDPEGKIPEDEPVFILRGQDVFAPNIVRAWIREMRYANADPKMIEKVEKLAEDMEDWQRNVKCKLPDL